jgi:RHS repeat-associated protein
MGIRRFGRVVDQNWLNTSTSSSTDDFQYGYDRDSNVLYMSNTVSSANSELYGYNSLNELTSFKRGTLNSGKTDMTGTPTVNKTWGLDGAGNWLSNGTELRSANKLNQITSISSLATPAYDNNGNTIIDQNSNTLIYDAWNRLVKVKFGATVLETDSYDALGRKVVENTGTARDIYFSQDWQDIEEDVSGAAKLQYVWGNGYIDHLVERDRDADGNSSNGLEEKLFAQQNANWDVTALIDTSGAVQERYQYDPYGTVTILTGAWGSRSGSSYTWAVLHQGGRFDTAIGLYDFRNREYNPVLGRWMQLDPLGFGGGDVNTYRSFDNNPSNRVDPSGLWNYWNPLTWGTGNPASDSWYNKLNPFGQSAHWGSTGLGLAQGGANLVNGVQDGAIGIVNLPATAWNLTGAQLGGNPAPYVPSPDWSKNLITNEGDTSHAVSKFLGGEGAITLMTLGAGQAAKLRHASKLRRAEACEELAAPSPELQAAREQIAKQLKEIARRRSLGVDPASGRYRLAEEEAALRLEQQTGRQLRRDPSGTGDWLDAAGRSYDAVGPVPAGRFDLGSFTSQIDRHLLKQGLDHVVVDLTGLSPAEAASVSSHIGNLTPAQQALIIVQPR